MVIEPRGLWEHNAYQTDTQLLLEVSPIQYDPNKLLQGTRSGYSGEKLSLNFQNVEVRSVLNVIADFTDLNIITSDTVGGNLTLRLKDVPWDQALDIILQTRGLDMRKNGNVIWIAPRDELATKEKLALESSAQITELEPLRTEAFQLNYARADAFAKLLADPQQRILSKRGAASVDLRTNQVFVQDVSVRLEEVRKLLGQVDVPVQQVLIEARIVEANDSFAKNLGVRLGNVARPLTQNSTSTGPSPVGINQSGIAVTQTGTLGDFERRNLDFVPQGELGAQGEAADHAGRQHHHDPGHQQGLSRPGHQPGFRHRHQARPDPGAGGKRRHGRDRRHLHPDPADHDYQSAVLRRPAVARGAFPQQLPLGQQDRALGVHHPAHRPATHPKPALTLKNHIPPKGPAMPAL